MGPMPNAAPPTALLPQPANARPARPVYFQTPGGAESHAKRRAMAESPVGLASPVKYVRNAWRAAGGSAVFVVESVAAQSDDYVVREATAAEILRAQQAGIRAEVERLYEKAREEDAAADRARAACFVLMHSKWAANARNEARELETLLTVSGVHRCVPLDDSEPVLSSERDSREVSL